MEITKEQAIEILDRIDFFQGQIAGRELWNEKPRYVQEIDLKSFQEDVALLRKYIADVVPKSESEFDSIPVEVAQVLQDKAVEKAKAEVAREIFGEIESISSDFPVYGNVNTVILSERDLAFIKKKYTKENIENENQN